VAAASRPQHWDVVQQAPGRTLRHLHAAPEDIAAEKTAGLPAGMSPAGTAFLLVTIAGLCAPLGACVVLFINTDKHVNMLPGGLALAAGVMILVSLFEVRTFPAPLGPTGLCSVCSRSLDISRPACYLVVTTGPVAVPA